MKVAIETLEMSDNGIIIASRLSDNWYLFISDYDGQKYWVSPEIVEFL